MGQKKKMQNVNLCKNSRESGEGEADERNEGGRERTGSEKVEKHKGVGEEKRCKGREAQRGEKQMKEMREEEKDQEVRK